MMLAKKSISGGKMLIRSNKFVPQIVKSEIGAFVKNTVEMVTHPRGYSIHVIQQCQNSLKGIFTEKPKAIEEFNRWLKMFS